MYVCILNHIKSQKLCYFGHAMRLPQDNIKSSFMTGLMEGVRGRGKPRIRWLEGVDWPICDQATASSTRPVSYTHLTLPTILRV